MRFAKLLFLAAVTACGPKAPAPDAPPSGSTGATGSTVGALTGPVLEQLAAPPYRYLRIKVARGELWAAVPDAKIETGATVTVANPVLMTQFESPSLKRTFDQIYFGTLAPEGAPTPGHGEDPHAGVPRSTTPIAVGKLAKATGADARTVADIWDGKASLEGRTVTLRGVVVKVNDGVMGRNWIHLQDGSGDAAQGSNDITVTTLDRATAGDTVTIKGTVRTNRDFGAGYVYPVMVEEATIARPT